MKKTLILILMILSSFSLISCDNYPEEYVINDSNLIPTNTIDDNNRVFYEIFTGSFSDSNGDGIGDLQGIINRLDYLNDGDPTSGKSLGIGGIWLTPIFKSPSYHKYDAADYYQIDPEFGNMNDLKKLIDECHKRDIKLIIDLVVNHSSTENEWFIKFAEAHKKGDVNDPYYDFYTYSTETEKLPGITYNKIPGTSHYYECNFSTQMPEFNFDNEEVRKMVIDLATYYLEMGVDGFRLDAAKYIYLSDNVKSAEFWEWFVEETKKVNENVYLVGEVWDTDDVIEKYLNAGLNCFNFSTAEYYGTYASAARCGNVYNAMTYIERFYNKNKETDRNLPFASFLSNHDMDRVGGYLSTEDKIAHMAANLYILTPGTPFIYYGEEIGMMGIREPSENTDANRRLAMLWGDKDTVKDPIGSTYSKDEQTNGTVVSQIGEADSLYNHYKKLIMIRNAYPEIARGDFKAIQTQYTQVAGFLSTYEGSTIGVIHNTALEAKEIQFENCTDYIFKEIKVVVGGEVTLKENVLYIAPQTTVILK